MLSHSHNPFRIISYLEGFSYLLLVFIAMPMKYLYGMPLMLKYIGMTHGVLFILFGIILLRYAKEYQLQKERIKDLFIYSLSPFGYILIEHAIQTIKKEAT